MTQTESTPSARAENAVLTVRVWASNVIVRQGARLHCPPIHPNIGPGEYRAYTQCAGDPVRQGDYANYYWVDIDTHEGRAARVCAVFLAGGRNNYPHPGIPVLATETGECPPVP